MQQSLPAALVIINSHTSGMSNSNIPALSATGKTAGNGGMNSTRSVLQSSVYFYPCSISMFYVLLTTSKMMFHRSTSSSDFDLSVPAVGKLESATVAWYLMPVRCTMSNTNSEKPTCHRKVFPEASDLVNSNLRASALVLAVNHFPCRDGCSSSTAHRTARSLSCTVASFISRLLRVLEQ